MACSPLQSAWWVAPPRVHLTNEDYQLPRPGGATFDGRDIFAPAAAHLANGVPITELGPEIDPATLLPGVLPISRFESGEHGQELVCEVLWVDHYGNCQLNVDPLELLSITDSPGGEVMVTIGAGSATPDERVGVRVDAYDQIPAGRIGLVVDSSGLLSIAVPAARRRSNSGSAKVSSCGSVISIRPTRSRRQHAGAARSPPLWRILMRASTTLVIGILLLVILGAAALQFVLLVD